MAENTELVRTQLLIVALVLLLPVLLMAFAWPMMGMWGGGHMWDGGMWNGAGSPWVWFGAWLIPLLILFGGGYLLYRAFTRPDRGETDTALKELRVAYARGDLSDEEFENRRERLRLETETSEQ